MSGKSRRSASAAIDRPFPATVRRQARTIASRYQVILREQDGGYFGRGLELPLAMGDGETPDECVARTRKAMIVCVATMLEDGETPPPPAAQGRRTEQVNIRLTPEEKLRMEETARTRGFRGISDFVRALAVQDGR